MGFIGFHKGWYRVSRYKVYDLGSCEDSVRVLSGYSFFMRSLRVVRCCSSGFITLKIWGWGVAWQGCARFRGLRSWLGYRQNLPNSKNLRPLAYKPVSKSQLPESETLFPKHSLTLPVAQEIHPSKCHSKEPPKR